MPAKKSVRTTLRIPALHHHVIEAVTPSVDGGRYPVKRVVGDQCVVEADVFRDGHQVIRAAVRFRRSGDPDWAEAPMVPIGNDRWRGEFELAENTRYVFTVIAWTDLFASWLADFRRRVETNHDAEGELLEGIRLMRTMRRRAAAADRQVIDDALKRLGRQVELKTALDIVSEPRICEIAEQVGSRFDLVAYAPELHVFADRPRAVFGAWYEMFPRSQGSMPGHASTLREAASRLSDIAAMGFDVVYLPPIHPIGVTGRKGPNNQFPAPPGSPGSPWAIGSSAGGHTAIDPALGTIEDFDYFVAVAASAGLEVALDFALQCSPDHPWVSEHPSWFYRRPDGSIRYAENPPKSYQDIYPINFDTPDRAGLVQELVRVLRFWIGHGVKIFRVDNPHTKPIELWRWLIDTIHSENPEVIFLSEAFTRPKVMKALAKAGFSQSYTYFTWRNTKAELTEYLTELTEPEMLDYFRPNFFTNTPDILTPFLQSGGPAAFRLRLVLAGTLSPSYGIYSGYELCENAAIPGTEEYLHSEKYEIRVRDWNAPGNIKGLVARLNTIRREHPALHRFDNLRILNTDSDSIMLYVKADPSTHDVILTAVNLDPYNPRECTAFVPPDSVGVAPGESYRVTDLLTGSSYTWSERNYVRLDPAMQPAHIFMVSRL
jgi:starch synthase (maltosyl-transferring)